jgi:hypothetical protein
MSEINAAAVFAPPFFPANKRLPDSIEQVQANVDLQNREEKAFKLALNAQTGLTNTPPCCKSLHISLFFDGTNNNEKASMAAARPNPSNIARLYHAVLEDIDSGYYSYYIPGVGTAFPEIGELDFSNEGLIDAAGGEGRINWALLRIVDAVGHVLTGDRLEDSEARLRINSLASVVPGTAVSERMKRQFIFSYLLEPLRAKASTHQPKILKIKLFVYGFSRGAAEARAFVNWLTDILDSELLRQKTSQPSLLGWPIAIEFLGLCDTVASVGIARMSPVSEGHMAWADDNLALPDESKFPGLIRNCYHFVSAHEQRLCFPLDSVRRTKGNYPARVWEVVYPGVHSDVGGGYSRGEQGKGVEDALILSQIVLHDLYAAAFAVGAPFRVPEAVVPPALVSRKPSRMMEDNVLKEFDISSLLVDRFNAWRTTLQADLPQTPTTGYQPVLLTHALESVVEQQMAWMTAWRIGRFANGSYQRQPFYQESEWNSGDVDEKRRDASAKARDKNQKEVENARKKGDSNLPGVPIFEPALDQQQLQQAANEFRADYENLTPYTVGMTRDNTGGVWLVLGEDIVGKIVYVLDPDDQSAEYVQMKEAGNTLTGKLFKDKHGTTTDDNYNAQVCALYDDHIHDSRAWFMHAALGTRELWAGYFRYRTIYSGDYANKETSLVKMVRKQGEVLIGIHIYAIQQSVKAIKVNQRRMDKLGAIIKQGMELSAQAQQLEMEVTAARNEKLREMGSNFIRGVVDKTKQLPSVQTCRISDATGQIVCQVPVYVNMISPVRDITELRKIYQQQEAAKDKQQMDKLVESLNSPVEASQ